jgi:hypothetical protein
LKTKPEPSAIIQRTYTSPDITSVWTIDKSIHPTNPIRVEHTYSKEFLASLKEKKKKPVAKNK